MDSYAIIIQSVMDDKHISTNDLPESSSRQEVRGFSLIKCSKPGCDWTWNTYRAHIVIDLIEQKVVRIYNQKCKKCDHENKPSFNDLVFREMVVKALEWEDRFRDEETSWPEQPNYHADDVDVDVDVEFKTYPHESSLCEKCGYGSSPCWEKAGASE